MKLPHVKTGAPTLAYAAQLQEAFEHYNKHLFDGVLPPCLMTFQRVAKTFGYFSEQRFLSAKSGEATDEIAINPQYLANYPPLEAMQTLVHEMVHMWQYHFGKPSKRSYHNREWAAKMEAIGLMPSSTGEPGGARTGEKMGDYPIRGGRFLQVTLELFAGEPFFLMWYDRFSAPGRRSSVALPVRVAQALSSPDVVVEVLEDDDGDASGVLPAWLTSAPASTHPDLAGALAVRTSGQSGQRHKYSCASCGVNVWDRKGLNLVCGECHEQFETEVGIGES